MSTVMLNYAHHLVDQSICELDNNQFLKSWALTVPARAAFACQGVVNAVELPFTMLGVLFRSLQFIYTFGRSSLALQNSLTNLDLTANRLLNSTIGALISPQLGSNFDKQGVRTFEGLLTAITIGAIAYAIIINAPQIGPNMIFVSPDGYWTFGWTWWQ